MERELAGTIERWFYWLGAVAFIAVVAYGFSFTVEQNLLHPKSPRPGILYVHAAIFASWLLLFFTQATLVRARQIRLHRSLGVVAIGLGTAVPIVGVWTAVVMARWRLQHGSTDADAFLIVPLGDVVLFSLFFSAAILLRRQPDYHRRLMFIATCVLTGAGFGRFPPSIVPDNWFYAGVDLLILLAIVRDLAAMRRVHAVFLVGLPILVVVQLTEMYSFVNAPPWWMDIAHKLLA
jgi:uncharacterized membrane protein (UPF0136 family)